MSQCFSRLSYTDTTYLYGCVDIISPNVTVPIKAYLISMSNNRLHSNIFICRIRWKMKRNVILKRERAREGHHWKKLRQLIHERYRILLKSQPPFLLRRRSAPPPPTFVNPPPRTCSVRLSIESFLMHCIQLSASFLAFFLLPFFKWNINSRPYKRQGCCCYCLGSNGEPVRKNLIWIWLVFNIKFMEILHKIHTHRWYKYISLWFLRDE